MSENPLVHVKIEFEKLGETNVKIIYLAGRITLANATEISKKIEKYFNDENYNVIVDLEKLEYLDSRGMAILLSLEKTVKENKGIFILTKANQFVHELFILTSLSTYFTFSNNLDDARSNFLNKT
ncbi:MAG: STAS domain-containing protein [Spirochaetia bacterium]|nr:STAS domain-containing protein [Spirochaetia bacterium]